jgi:[ribosomal protein S5]-alanine N-acetyltransferase
LKFSELHTERLILTEINPGVHEYIYNNLSDDELLAFLGLSTIESLESDKRKYIGGLTTFNKSYLYHTIKNKATGNVIGRCGYHTWYTQHNRAEVFYDIYPEEFKRKGIMTEALRAVLNFGFTEMNLHRVEAMTATYNNASINTLKKFGFTQEGTLREHYLVDDKMEDSLMFSLLKHEFTL